MTHLVTDENTVSVDGYVKTLRREQPGIVVPEDSDGRDIVETFKRQMDRLDMEIDELHEQRFVDTATGKHLERIGARFGVEKKEGESEEKFRKRIEGARNASLSRGTYQDVARVAIDIMDTDPSNIDLKRAYETGDEGTGVVTVPGNVIDDSPLTQSEMANILSDAAVGGHRIQIQQSDAFTFGDSNLGFGTEWGQTIE